MRLSALPSFLKRRWRWILGGTAITMAVVIAAAFVFGYTKYRQVVGEIHHVAIHDLGKRPPVYSTSSENILIFGSDSRAGLDHHQQVLLHTGSDQGNNTDTIIVMHLSPGRHLVTAMSIPRDTVVPFYQCDRGPGYPGQQANPNAHERINSLLAAGGPSCLWKTVEQQTGIHIDHFVEIGMAGFVNVINDLGGVNVCVPFTVNDSVSGLALPKGEHHIDGVTALAFWRTRENLGQGSDLQRIQRDQFMAAQVVKGILATGLLGDPLKLFRVAGDLAPNLTIDSGLSISNLVSIGESLHGLSARQVQFVTAPVVAWPYDPNEVEFSQPGAARLFAAIAHDSSIPKGTGTTSPAPAQPALAAPTPGKSGPQAVGAVRATTAPAKHPVPTTGPATTSHPAPATGPASTASPTSSAIQSLAATNGGITGAAACASDSSAFSGPNSP